VGALAKPEVGEYLEKYFVSSFQKVATFTIVNGQKQGGNVASYFCATDGRVLHTIAGPVDAATFVREAKWVVENVKKALEESRKSETPFKVLWRKLHAERLKKEHGLVVEAATFDPPEKDGPLVVKDADGRELLPALPPPPIDGPDVEIHEKKMAAMQAEEGKAGGCRELKDKNGRGWRLGTQGQVHQIMAAYAMVKIENVFATVFENLLGEKVTTRPVITIRTRGGGDAERDEDGPCLHCGCKVE
jgi:hypothetical protein